jgi:hypothetical protein
MILIVSYDLKAVRDYTPFYEMLKKQGTSWSHYLSSTWLLATTRTPREVVEAVKPYMGPNDFILVGQFSTAGYFGWLPHEAWEWLKAQSQPELPFNHLAALLGSGADAVQK